MLSEDIKIVGYNPIYDMVFNSNKTFTSKLLNYVESYEIEGVDKTLFYTEVNSELKVGDKVFIINGIYDSNLLIENNKYKKGRDGYKVLLIDKCKVVLDIDYTDNLPYLTGNDDDFIKIYYIKDIKDFIHANRQITTNISNPGSDIPEYSFSNNKNNIAFIDGNESYLYNGNWGKGSVIGTPGFFVKNSDIWTKIALSDILSGYYTFNNADRIKIMNSDFTYDDNGTIINFKEGFVYKFDSVKGWIIDILYLNPYLSKSNFRDGNFNGEWNSGLYGQYSKSIEWSGTGIWNTGVLVNTIWKSGYINSLHKPNESYFSDVDFNGLPYQKLNSDNNADRGFNFIYDSELEISNIVNGTFINTNFGNLSYTYSVVENEILNSSIDYLVNVKSGFFKNCNFLNSLIENSELKKITTYNSKLENDKVINSYLNSSVLKNSLYNSDSIIKIYSYDVLTSCNLPDSYNPDGDHKVFKFYIDKDGYNRLKNGNSFYLKGITINNNSNDILNFFDKKFKITSYTEYTEENFGINENGKKGYDYSSFLSTPLDNSYLFGISSIGSKYYTKIGDVNPNSKYYSVDIWVSRYDIDNIIISENINFDKSIVDIKNAYIIDSDYNSGLMINSDWNNGNHIESNNDNNITIPSLEGGYYNLSIDTDLSIIATTSYDSDYSEYSESEKINVGDVVFLNSVDLNDGNIIRLPDSYKVVSISNNGSVYKLAEIGTYSQITSTSSGYFYTDKSENRYGYISKLKIDKTKIKSGIFKRSYISNSLIQNLDFDYMDKELKNKEKLRKLIISDNIFSNNSNIFSNALYLNSFFVNGSDNWVYGIIQNSIWNGGTFSNGIIRDTRWVDGIFDNGYFYKSRTFNGNPSTYSTNFYSENINSYYRKGTLPNNRNSWQNGKFLNGDFNKSDWEGGTFSNGKFYNSKWYDGNFENGIIGDIKLSYYDTYFYNGTISYAIVDNASIYANDTSTYSIPQNINWINGIFNNGIFGSSQLSTAIWKDGTFNGGQFISNAKWKNGIFNNGKFISAYGWTQSDSIYEYDYSWENGTFNNGEFGNANGLTNSTWYTGDFNDGVFKGRVWNNGVFLYGEFQGSGENPVGGLTCANANIFVDSFTNSYWGKWRNGVYTDTKDKFIKDKKIYTDIVKASTLEKSKSFNKKSTFKNGLWMSGTFSHKNGEMLNSVWLDGVFEDGVFKSSSFNPYVKRNGSTSSSFNFNDLTCYWKNGNFDDSDFYISRWKNGNFIMGTATGMIWEDGISFYMNAINVFWEKGTWKNGNWYGSSFEFNGEIEDDYVLNIIKRGVEYLGTYSCHVWNIFSMPIGEEKVLFGSTSSEMGENGWASSYYGEFSSENDDVEEVEVEIEEQT